MEHMTSPKSSKTPPYFRRRGHCDVGVCSTDDDADHQLVDEWMTNEDWYAYTRHVAELRCAVTMLPLLLVSCYWFPRNPPVGLVGIAASLASALYHARPFKLWLRLDQFWAAALILSLLFFFEWEIVAYYAVPLGLLVLDTASRWFAWRYRVPYLHEVWHSSGGLFMHLIMAHHYF